MVYSSTSEFAFLETNVEIKKEKDHQRTQSTAPLVTFDALLQIEETFPQAAVLGKVLHQNFQNFDKRPKDSRVYLNCNAPFSAVVCGVQGSGKSWTSSVILENCLIPHRHLGALPTPLAGLVFHFDSTGNKSRPCEAAYLSSLKPQYEGETKAPEVIVLVSPTNIKNMRRTYSELPNVQVKPLVLSPVDITAMQLLTLMHCEDDMSVPLYMHHFLCILRKMGADNFSYHAFRDKVRQAEKDWNPSQKQMLQIRLALLDSFIDKNSKCSLKNYFQSGRLVIVDLSDPFIPTSSACALFHVILNMFLEPQERITGKIVILDEAHKYLSLDVSSKFCSLILESIRLQRHHGLRLVIATQEPTVVPTTILSLATFLIVHRFSSPAWARHLANHVSVGQGENEDSWFTQSTTLSTGEGLLFAPTGIGLAQVTPSNTTEAHLPMTRLVMGSPADLHRITAFGQGWCKFTSRQRLTVDGGGSLLSTSTL